MSITKEDVAKLSRLSMLEFSDEDVTRFQNDLGKILDFVSQLQEVNTDDVQPMASTVVNEGTPEREDNVTAENRRDAYLKVAPSSEEGFFVVPRVVE